MRWCKAGEIDMLKRAESEALKVRYSLNKTLKVFSSDLKSTMSDNKNCLQESFSNVNRTPHWPNYTRCAEMLHGTKVILPHRRKHLHFIVSLSCKKTKEVGRKTRVNCGDYNRNSCWSDDGLNRVVLRLGSERAVLGRSTFLEQLFAKQVELFVNASNDWVCTFRFKNLLNYAGVQ